MDRRRLLTTLGLGATSALTLGPLRGAVAGQPPIPSGCPAEIAATLKAARLSDWIGGRDDAHIQRAIDALAPAGGMLFVDAGAPIRIAAPIRVRSGVHLVGLPSGLPQKANFGHDRHRLDITAGERKGDSTAILLDPSSSSAGFTMFWPGQRGDAARPTEYGWALGTSGAGAGADNIMIERMMLTNPWRGINMDHGGQWRLSDIYGQPIETGIRVDRMLDVSQICNVHWWDFAVQSGPLHDYILAHCIGLAIGKADNLMASRLFGYNIHTLLRFADFGHGSAWAQINDVSLDRGIHVIDIESIHKLQIDRVVATQPTSGTGQPVALIRSGVRKAQVTLNGAMFDNVSNGIVVEDGADGRFAFTGISSQKRSGTGNNQQYGLVVEGQSAEVIATGLAYQDVAGPVSLDGMNAITLDRDATPETFGSPHRWASNSRVKPTSSGSRFDLAGPVTTIGFVLPASIVQEVALFALDATLTIHDKEQLGPGQFYIRMSNGAINDIVLPSQNFGGFFERPTRIIKAFPLRSASYRLEFVFGGATGPCTMDITRLRLWQLDPTKLDPRLLDWVYAKAPNEASLPSNVSLITGTRVTRQSAAPTAGTHRAGDRVIASDFANGKPRSWTCTIGGSPGIWLPEGA